MPAFLTLQSLAATTPDGTPLFSDLSLSCHAERTGIVGANGSGKSTLLRMMAGDLMPASGHVTRSGTVAMMQQAWPDRSIPVRQALGVAADLERLQRIEEGKGSDADLEEADWLLPARLEAILDQIGLDASTLEGMLSTLSGGQMTRVAIARILLEAPNLLLLDEPTNNLDPEGRQMVLDLVDGWQGGVVVVSHDRDLLRHVDRILSLSASECHLFGGAWDAFEGAETARKLLLQNELERSERAVKQVRQQIQQRHERKARRDKQGRAQRRKGDQPKMLLDMQAERAEKTASKDAQLARKLEEASRKARDMAVARLDIRPPVVMQTEAGTAGGFLIRLEGVALARGRLQLGPVTAAIRAGERVHLAGSNGTGKSTLLSLISGELEPDRGTIHRAATIAVLDQQVDRLDPDLSLRDAVRRLDPALGLQQAHALLARFGFRNVVAEKPLRALSGGERLRAGLAVALGSRQPPDLLILDEPTNHLDLDTITILEDALNRYEGALLVASHDPEFVARICLMSQWSLADGQLAKRP